MHLNVKNRYQASLLHFSASLLIFSALIFILLSFWYPAPYFTASGGWQGLKIVAAVDLVLGPALTLIVFNIKKSKTELFTDLSIIIAVQMTALTWGIVTVYNQRPVASVFWDDGFYTVTASSLKDQGVNLDVLDKFGNDKPVYIYAAPPESIEEKQAMITTMLNRHIPPYQEVDRFRPVDQHFDEIYNREVDITEIISENREMKKEIDNVLGSTGTSLNENHYVSLVSKYRNIVLVFDRQNQLVGTASAPFKKDI